MIVDLIRRNRSCRRFVESHEVSRSTLLDLVDLARLSASAANRQPLRFLLSNEANRNAHIFACLGWAAYLKEWKGPAPGERPAAYITILGDTEITKQFWCDDGIAAQSILLGAVEKGLSGCMIGAINKPRLRASLNIPEQFEIMLVLALGRPAEKIVIEPLEPEGDIRYWRDESGVHHVPKRSLDELIVEF